jgi:hypothetical protein
MGHCAFWSDRMPVCRSSIPIVWRSEQSGHLCLQVRLESDQNPVTGGGDVPGDNSIAQRNVHAVELERPLFGSSGSASVEAILCCQEICLSVGRRLAVRWSGARSMGTAFG